MQGFAPTVALDYNNSQSHARIYQHRCCAVSVLLSFTLELLLRPYVATNGYYSYYSTSSITYGAMAENASSTGSREHNGPNREEATSAASMVNRTLVKI
jgi:hypothetical protein